MSGLIVIKVGGGQGIDLDSVCADIAELHKGGRRLILLHGGNYEANQVAEQLGHPPKFVTSISGIVSRRTDRRTLEIMEMVYAGKINKGIVEKLQALGANAVGLSGIDGRVLEGKRKDSIKIVEDGRKMVLRDDYTGTVTTVNTGLLRLLLDNGYLPVLTPPAISTESEAINVDGDRAAAVVAGAMQAEQLIILANVPGLLREFPDESTLIPHIPAARLEAFMQYADGRMKKKVMGAGEALAAGVPRVVFGDARGAKPVQRALAGEGTVID
jgi:acetylglutamate/LysW-gamma-L-alpha-aminoadipate kinase